MLWLAKQSDKSARLVQNRVLYKGKLYTKDRLQDLPLNLKEIGMKVTDTHVCFAGKYSVLSNLHPCSITYAGRQFRSAEHLYQYRKCIDLQRADIAEAVCQAEDAYDALRVSKAVQADKNWVMQSGRDLMKEVVLLKCQQVPRMADVLKQHNTRGFVEATVNPLWGSGITLASNDATSPETWKGLNLFGKILNEIVKEMQN